MAECDGTGNINASKFGKRIAGCGGFINLSQNSKRVYFLGTFTSGGLQADVADGQLTIQQEGRFNKFLSEVGQITFSAQVAATGTQLVRYITERCVFDLTPNGLELIEVAPGIDLQSQILDLLPFEPIVNDVGLIDPAIFEEEPIGLRARLFDIKIDDRLSYDQASNTVFMDYSGMRVRTTEDVGKIKTAVDTLLAALARRVHSVVNYDRFDVDPEVEDDYFELVRYVQDTYYESARRYTSNAFKRLQLAHELEKHAVEPSLREQVRLMRQLLAHIDAGTTVDAGAICRIPTSTYTDADQAEQERQQFFLRTPQCVGLSGDLAGPGAFLTSNDLGISILATRDGDGTFRAFINSCRHRGAIVETEPRGSKRRFTCPFHAWTYDSSGGLVGLPKPDHFGDVDTKCLGLTAPPAEERHGLLFVHPDPEGAIDLDDHLGDKFNGEFPTWSFDELTPINRDIYDTGCNWKLAMDTFGETYHFSSLHKDSLFNTFHGNVQCYDEYGHNHRMILCHREIDEMRHKPEEEWDISVAALPVYWIFPNVILMPFRFGCFLARAYPTPGDPGHHVSRVDFYMKSELANATGREAVEVNEFIATVAQSFSSIIRDEDYVMGESQHAAANAGSLEYILFGRNEPALHHYHGTYAQQLGRPVGPTPF